MLEPIKDWIDRVIIRRPELKGMSVCPFAKKALKENTIFIFPFKNITDISIKINEIENFEIIIFYDENKTLSNNNLIEFANELNKNNTNLIFLKDHPDDPGYINGICTGNMHYPMILVQPKDSLLKARDILSKTMYYSFWTEEYKKQILDNNN
jgi:hypothetical protein